MRYFALLLLCTLLAACVTPPPPKPAKPEVITARYRAAQWRDLPDWPGEQLNASWSAWLQSCTKLRNRAEWKPLCDAAAALPPDSGALRDFFERNFTPWRIETNTGENTGLITGYYEVLLKGGLDYKPGRVPLYAVPDDLLIINLGSLYPELKGTRVRGRLEGRTVVPYWDRRDIDSGKAATANKVLAWADDPIEAFFLQVQGAGRLVLEDGSMLRLGYADQNGHPYHAIGKWLVQQGELPLEQITMQSIRAWARAHPERVRELLENDPSYIFFRIVPDNNLGPVGALNVPLTAQASIAVDPKFIPLGSPIYLATTYPPATYPPTDTRPLNRLVCAQDTGGAIRGPIRADYFWGSDAQAAELAGRTKQRGAMWLLWPNTMALPNPQ